MNKKILWPVIIVAVVILIAAGISGNSNKAKDGKFKIGVILPLSGPVSALGEAAKDSINLALSTLSPADKKNIEIVYGDDQFDPKQTVSVAQKLIDTDSVKALIVYSSPSSVAASYIAEKNSIPMIGLGNSTEINTGKQWVMRYMLGPLEQAQAIESLLLKGKFTKVALVWNQSDGPKSVHDQLVKILPEQGYTIVADESVTKAENDFKTSILKIKAVKPEVVVAYISPQIGVFGKQAKDLGLNVPIVSGPPMEQVSQLTVAQGGLDNQLFVGNDNVAFTDAFHAKFNMYPSIAGDYAYDALIQFIQAANQTDKSGTAIMQSLRKSFTGVSGEYIYNNDGSFNVKQVVKKWDGSKFVVVR